MFSVHSLKNLALVVAVVCGVGLSFVLGPDRVSRETRAAVQRVEDAFDKSVSNAQLIATARVTLNDQEEKARRLEDHQVEIDDRISEARGVITQAENELLQNEDVLRIVKLKLVNQADSFEINGRAYSRADVEIDVEKRLQLCRDATARLTAEQEALRQLESIKVEVANNLRELKTVRQEKARELELLAAQIKNAEVYEQLQGLELKFKHSTGDKTKFEQTVAEIRNRIRESERQAARRSKKSDLIDWTSKKSDLVAEIDAQLKRTPTTPAVVQK